MNMIRIVTMLLALLMPAAVALAENRAETFIVSPYAGGYTFQGNQHLKTAPVYGLRLGYNITDNLAVEGVVDYVKTDSTRGNGNMKVMRYGGDLVLSLMPNSSLVPYLAAGFGGVDLKSDGVATVRKGIFNYGGGLKWFFADMAAVRADVRGLNYSVGELYTNVEYTLGLHLAIGASKPAPKPVEPPPVVEPPKPAPPVPAASLKANPSRIEKGSAATLTWDSQNATSCDIQPGIGQVAPQGSKVVTPSADTTYSITCKGEGGVASGSAGVSVMLPPPPPPPVVVPKATAAGTKIALDIKFDTGKSNIKKKYHEEIKKVGDVLNAEKNLRGIIEGHTDNVGGHAMNMRLSQRRADAVRTYIVKQFKIDQSRLAAKGFGPDQPIADNATAEGRQQNRRIHALFEENPSFKEVSASEQKAAPAKVTKKKVAKKKAPAAEKAPAAKK